MLAELRIARRVPPGIPRSESTVDGQPSTPCFLALPSGTSDGWATKRKLRVWTSAVDFAVACYEMSGRFPRAERFGLTSQIRRSAASIAANIAEGAGRKSDRDCQESGGKAKSV